MKKSEFTSSKSHYNRIQFQSGSGLVMGVGGEIHDDAVDVTYSTRPNINNFAGSGLTMGEVEGINDDTVDVTYSTSSDTNKFTSSSLFMGVGGGKNDEKDEKIKDLEIKVDLLNKQILEQKNEIFFDKGKCRIKTKKPRIKF